MVPLSSEASQNFHDWVWKQIAARKTSDNTRSSLIKLAHSATLLHIAGLKLRKAPWVEGTSPLAVAVAALGTAVKRQESSNG
jgi:hypothetical protein